MPRGCDHAIHVYLNVGPRRGFGLSSARIGRRHFIVEYDADGDVIRVKERRLFNPGEPEQQTRDMSYWKAGTHPTGNGKTLIKDVLAAATAKRAAQDWLPPGVVLF